MSNDRQRYRRHRFPPEIISHAVWLYHPFLQDDGDPPGVGDNMNKLCILIGATVLGWVGWWLGARIGFMTAYVLSGIGSIVGVYVGWRINRDYLS